jgi:rare lipoprotein A
MRPYQIRGVWYYPAEQPDYDQVGIGSWYGEQFHNRSTSNGELFDMDRISAAHKTLPLPSMVEVTNLDNGRRITLRVNDRGPFVDGRIIDLSKAAADELGYRDRGVARVRVRYLGPAPKDAFDGRRYAEGKVQPTPAPYKPQPYKPEPIAPAATPKPRFALADSGGYRVQVASFANRDNADRAASALGEAVVESTERDGIPLYRVMLGPADDEPAAWALRDRAAAQGFADARVLRP